MYLSSDVKQQEPCDFKEVSRVEWGCTLGMRGGGRQRKCRRMEMGERQREREKKVRKRKSEQMLKDLEGQSESPSFRLP